jgi:hypothetical protein
VETAVEGLMLFSVRRRALTVNGSTTKIERRRGRVGSGGRVSVVLPKSLCYK